MKERVYNFGPGPAVLPDDVLERTSEAVINYDGSGIGIMECSHRSAEFEGVISTAETNLRELLEIPADYSIIFMGGGATTQFSMVPMNFLQAGTEANFLITGPWAEKAFKEAGKFGDVHTASSSKDKDYTYIPQEISLSATPSYAHFTSNNTIAGTQYAFEPDLGDVPLVCDASSDLLHKKIDVSKYALIYAGAQKNLGPAGVTLVILRNDLLEHCSDDLPVYLNYSTHVSKKSLYNTPPVFAIYVLGEVLKWVRAAGGLEAMEKRNRRKAAALYDAIDRSDFYRGVADKDSRSLMNVTFRMADSDLEPEFVRGASESRLAQLKGHRSVGGLRASIYNAFPEEGVQALVDFMQEFERRHG